MEDTLKYNFNSSDLLYKIYSHRKVILIISSIALVISTIISLLITPKYQASTVLFPAPSISISRSLLSSTANIQKNSMFGEDEEVEQILQVLSSEELQMNIVKRFDLINHYEIDPNDPHIHTELNKKWKKNITFGRTQFMAIEISVLDKDPKLAAKIANAIASTIDTVMSKMEKERSLKAYNIAKSEYFEREKQVQFLADSVKKLMKLGVFDVSTQTLSLYKGLTQALTKGNYKAAEAIEKKIAIMAQYGSTFLAVKSMLDNQNYQLSILNTKCNEAKVDAEQSLTHIYVVDRAYQPDKKAYPKRLLIILISTISTFLLSILLIIILDTLKEFRNKNIKSII